MVDSVAVFSPGQRLQDASGTPYATATVTFYDAGTGNAKEVYSDANRENSLGNVVYTDSAGYPVTSQGGSTKTQVFTDTSPYKIVIADTATGETITHDNCVGAVVSGVAEEGTDGITQDEADLRYVRNANALGSSTTIDDADIFGVWKVSASGNRGITYGNLKTEMKADGGFYNAGGGDVAVSDGGTGGSTAVAGFDNLAPTTTRGDLIIRDASNNVRLPIGAANRLLRSDGTDASWGQLANGDIPDSTIAYAKFAGAATATQSDQETGTSTTTIVTPGRQQFHAGHPKAWGYVTVSTGTPTLATSYNMTSITDTALGRLGTTIATDFSGANYCAQLTITPASISSGGSNKRYPNIAPSTKTGGTVEFNCTDQGGTPDLNDPAAYDFMMLGDQ